MRKIFLPAIFIMNKLNNPLRVILATVLFLLSIGIMLNWFDLRIHMVNEYVSLAIMLIIYYFFIAFYYSVMRSVAVLEKASFKIVAGNLNSRIDLENLDELHIIGRAMNQMTATFYLMTKKQGKIEEALKEQKGFAENLVQNSSIATFVINQKHEVILWNKACEELTGIPAKHIVGTNRHSMVFYEDSRPTLADLLMDDELNGNAFYRILEECNVVEDGLYAENWFPNLNGRNQYIAINAAPIYNSKGERVAVIETLQNIAENKLTEDRLRLSATVFENSLEGIIVTDSNGRILLVNPAFTSITGFDATDVLWKNIAAFGVWKNEPKIKNEIWESVYRSGIWQGEIWNDKKNGDPYLEWLTIIEIRDEQKHVINYVLIFSDVTLLKETEKKLKHMAYHDTLTDLLNRSSFYERIKGILSIAESTETKLALLFLDMDQFKLINDSLGHSIGDCLLLAISRRLANDLGYGDMVFRLGGDEFTIVFPDFGELSVLKEAAQKIIENLSKPFKINQHELFITTSAGISVYPQDGETIEELTKNADTAMYQAKKSGGNTFQFYTPEMNKESSRKLELMNQLPRAFENNEFVLFYQPQYDLLSGRIVGVEALIRWQHPEWGMIPPIDFIPLAEENGWIEYIGEWVLYTACTQNKKWQDLGFSNIRIAVNLSVRQFMQRNLVERISTILTETGLKPNYLELEITESISMYNVEKILETLRQLDAMGVRIAIDDFGTGYSSLNYLKKFPIDVLKIDKSFVNEINFDRNDIAITQSIISIAHGLDLEVIAEGVENETQLIILKNLNCDLVQGYLFSKPLPLDEINKLLTPPIHRSSCK